MNDADDVNDAMNHWHCPHCDVDKPQAIKMDEGSPICGRCWIIDVVIVRCVLCTPEICEV